MENKQQSNGEMKEKVLKKKLVSEFLKSSANVCVSHLGSADRKYTCGTYVNTCRHRLSFIYTGTLLFPFSLWYWDG